MSCEFNHLGYILFRLFDLIIPFDDEKLDPEFKEYLSYPTYTQWKTYNDKLNNEQFYFILVWCLFLTYYIILLMIIFFHLFYYLMITVKEFYVKYNQHIEEEVIIIDDNDNEEEYVKTQIKKVRRDNIKDDDCGICLEPLKINKIKKMITKIKKVIAYGCNHQLHKECFNMFIKTSNNIEDLEDDFYIEDNEQYFRCPICNKLYKYNI